MDDLISVIVPVYNIAGYLPNSIGSLLRQSYAKLEIVAVDDGSTDDSLAVLRELAAQDARVRVIHRENGGVTRARLDGVQAAQGAWIGFMDGDDEIEPDMYERLLRNALDHHADISHCGYQMHVGNRVDYYYNTGRLLCQTRQDALQALLSGAYIEPCLGIKLYRRELFCSLLNENKMDLSVKNTEDLLMNFYLFREAESAVYEDFCPYHYMVRPGSAATSALNEHKLRDPLLVLKTIRDACAGEEQLLRTVNARVAACLIGLATLPKGGQEALAAPCRSEAQRELRALLPELFRGAYSARTKGLSAWAALGPGSYRAVHRIYARLRGTDKKYEVK